MTLRYDELFQDEEQLKKFIELTDILDPCNTDEYRWTLGDGTDDIKLYSVNFKYRKVIHPAKYVDVFYNTRSETIIVTNAVTGASVSTDNPKKAAAVAISYADSFTAYR